MKPWVLQLCLALAVCLSGQGRLLAQEEPAEAPQEQPVIPKKREKKENLRRFNFGNGEIVIQTSEETEEIQVVDEDALFPVDEDAVFIVDISPSLSTKVFELESIFDGSGSWVAPMIFSGSPTMLECDGYELVFPEEVFARQFLVSRGRSDDEIQNMILDLSSAQFDLGDMLNRLSVLAPMSTGDREIQVFFSGPDVFTYSIQAGDQVEAYIDLNDANESLEKFEISAFTDAELVSLFEETRPQAGGYMQVVTQSANQPQWLKVRRTSDQLNKVTDELKNLRIELQITSDKVNGTIQRVKNRDSITVEVKNDRDAAPKTDAPSDRK